MRSHLACGIELVWVDEVIMAIQNVIKMFQLIDYHSIYQQRRAILDSIIVTLSWFFGHTTITCSLGEVGFIKINCLI